MSANKQVVLIHGWSETKSSEAFRSLVDFLESHGFNAVSLWLGDYISLEDDVRIEDVARPGETELGSAGTQPNEVCLDRGRLKVHPGAGGVTSPAAAL
jgi:hypothetical protein